MKNVGKYLAITVAAAVITGGGVLYSVQRTSVHAQQRVVEYDEEVIAREIARSALHVGWQRAQAAGPNLDGALINLNGTLPNGRPDFGGQTAAEYQRGSYDIHGYVIDGQTVRIRARGYFGAATHVVQQTYRVRQLVVRDFSDVSTGLLESAAGLDSSVHMRRRPIDFM